MTSITQIENACRELSACRAQLRRRHELCLQAVRAAEAGHTSELLRLHERCGALRASLEGLVEQARPEFRKPKTREFHGLTVGFEKARDTIEMPDDDLLVDRIEKMLPVQQGETVLDRSVSIIKSAFKKLPAEVLRQLGCKITTGGDHAVVRANDDDIESLVQRSFGDASSAGIVARAPSPVRYPEAGGASGHCP